MSDAAAPQSGVTAWLSRAPTWLFSAWAIAAAFSTYFSMYAFRKPFGAGTFEGSADIPGLGQLDYKILFVISQILGYALSKLIGIKVVSEMSPSKRAVSIIVVLSIAWGALLAFAIVPAPYNAICMFINGLPLGMVWGLVFGFLEGRRVTELLGAGLSTSYIVASGIVKSVGKWLMVEHGVSEYWMPFVVGGVFFLPMIFFVWMLKSLPPPTPEDVAARTARVPMDAKARNEFFWAFAPGLIPLTGLYVLLTAYRDVRDNYAVELWAALGRADDAAILATAELPIAFGVLVVLALVMFIKDNRAGLIFIHAIMLAGTVLIGLSTWLWQTGIIEPTWWMILVGLGLYIAYVPYGCVLFDRLIAAVGWVATAGFLIYVTDFAGYVGSVALQLYKTFGQAELEWIEFFTVASYATSVVCSVAFVFSTIYFARITRPGNAPVQRHGGPVQERA